MDKVGRTAMNTTQRLDQEKGIYLYVLELQNDKYYVGITHNPKDRFRKHTEGRSQQFVRENLPIKTIEVELLNTVDRKIALVLETLKTIELIEKYGIENVHGGVITGDLERRIAKLESCYNKKSKLYIPENFSIHSTKTPKYKNLSYSG